VRRPGIRNRAICLILALLPGLLLAARPAAAWPSIRRWVRVRRPARLEQRVRPPRAERIPVRPLRLPPARPRYRSAGELPGPRFGTVRLYRGTGHPDHLQVAPSMRGRPAAEVPRGDQSFFGPLEGLRAGHRHGFGADDPASDAVSTTTDLYTARTYARSHRGAVLVYDIPRAVFDQLPRGDPATGEYVFRYSVPDAFLVGVLAVDSSTH
jgi:hypothetical protein